MILSADYLSNLKRRGVMLILSSPSGAGKSSIAKGLLARESNLRLSTSYTTRPPRRGEVDGQDYFFVDQACFDRMILEGQFLEHAQVFDYSYGTPKKQVEGFLSQGFDVLFDIDWQGTQKICQIARADVITLFILPPSLIELQKRLQGRAQDSEEVVRRRMAAATAEMSHWAEYDYVIINKDLDQSIEQASTVLTADRLRRSRQLELHDFVRQISYERL